MPINWSVWSIKPGRRGWAKRYPPTSYPAAEVLKVALMNANRDDPNVWLFIMKERTPLEIPQSAIRSRHPKRRMA